MTVEERLLWRRLAFREHARCRYWLDLDNTEATAQVVLGEPDNESSMAGRDCDRLPCVTELFPELLDATVAEGN